jgi:FkbM family methyltransferase
MTASSVSKWPPAARLYKFLYRHHARFPLSARVGKFSLFEQLKFRLYPRMMPRFLEEIEVTALAGTPEAFRLNLRGADGSVSLDLILQGAYEPEWAGAFRDWFKSADAFLDVGANLGYYSIWAARLEGGPSNIHSFEPVTRTREKFLSNLKLNGLEGKVTVHAVAAGEREGAAEITVGDDLGLSSLVPPADGQASGGQTETIKVSPVQALVSLEGQKIFCKIDAEGFEWPALKGMQILWRKNPCRLFFEFTPRFYARLHPGQPSYATDFLQWLQDEGFTLRAGDCPAQLVPVSDPAAFVGGLKAVQTHILAEKGV